MIERRAVCDDADWCAAGIVEIIPFHRDHIIAARQSEPCEIPEKIGKAAKLRSRLVDRAAVVQCFQPIQRIEICFESIRQAIDEPCAGANVHAAPFASFECCASALHRAVNIRCCRVRNFRDYAAGRRIAHIDQFTGACLDFPAIDEIAANFDA